MTPKQIELAFKAKLITDIEQLEEGINIVYTCNSVTIGEFANLVIADACKDKDARIAELESLLADALDDVAFVLDETKLLLPYKPQRYEAQLKLYNDINEALKDKQ